MCRSRRRFGAVPWAVALLLVAATALGAPSAAQAMPGPSRLALGVVDDLEFESPAPDPSLWLSRAQADGGAYVRLTAWWNLIAPGTRPRGFDGANPRDPHYRWATLDAAVRNAAAHDQTVVLMALDAPSWAQAPGRPAAVDPGTWFPNDADFRAFAHALAERYSGSFPDPLHRGRALPRVRYLQAWNEPNLPIYLMPQWGRTKGGAWQPVSPGIYRGMLNAFYAGVKSAQPSSTVLSAGTAPYGDPPGTAGGRMHPVTFLEGLFCLTPSLRPAPCPDPPHLDAVDHHPYGLTPTARTPNPDDIGVPDVWKVRRIVAAAERFGHVVPAGPKPLWVTELDWSSSGPGTSPATQARYLALGFYQLWAQDVTHILWYELSDPSSIVDTGGSFATAGLYYRSGVPKPAVAAYRFPFVALSTRQRKLVLWGRAPSTGVVEVQQLVRGRWRRFARLPTTSGGIFYRVQRPPHTPQPRLFRAVIGPHISPIWVNG